MLILKSGKNKNNKEITYILGSEHENRLRLLSVGYIFMHLLFCQLLCAMTVVVQNLHEAPAVNIDSLV